MTEKPGEHGSKWCTVRDPIPATLPHPPQLPRGSLGAPRVGGAANVVLRGLADSFVVSAKMTDQQCLGDFLQPRGEQRVFGCEGSITIPEVPGIGVLVVSGFPGMRTWRCPPHLTSFSRAGITFSITVKARLQDHLQIGTERRYVSSITIADRRSISGAPFQSGLGKPVDYIARSSCATAIGLQPGGGMLTGLLPNPTG